MDTSGLAGSCLAVQTENSQTIATGYYYCSQQPTSFSSPYCYDPQNGICYGSLYLPDLTFEDMTTTWGAPVNVGKTTTGLAPLTWRETFRFGTNGGTGRWTGAGGVSNPF